MSRIRANKITNQLADGSPTVEKGLIISGITTSTTFSGSGASLTNLNASNIASGTVPTARLGSGTASSSTFLRGDSTFQTVNTDLVSDTSPQLGGDLDTNSYEIFLDAGHSLKLATNQGQIYHSGSQMYIGTNDLRITNYAVNETMAKFVADGAVELYHNDSKKFETTSSGATLTGDLYTTSRLLVNTTSAGESNGDEATFANPGGNAGITIRSAVNNECKIYFSEGTSGGSQYRGAINYNQNTNYMAFSTNENERWRITSDGTMYPQGNYTLGLNSNTAFRMNEVNSNKFVHRYGNSGSAGTNQQEAIWYGGGITVMHDNATLSTSNYTWGLTGSRGYALIRIRNNAGSPQAIYAEAGSISSGSDYRMKENIVEITNGIETVKKLKPSIYNIRKTFNPNDDGKKHHGFVAHEVQEAIPDIGNIVSGTKDAMEEVFYDDEDENIPAGKKAGDSTGAFTDQPDYQGIDYGHMTPVLAAAIKELITKVETLESKVSTLEGS